MSLLLKTLYVLQKKSISMEENVKTVNVEIVVQKLVCMTIDLVYVTIELEFLTI